MSPAQRFRYLLILTTHPTLTDEEARLEACAVVPDDEESRAPPGAERDGKTTHPARVGIRG